MQSALIERQIFLLAVLGCVNFELFIYIETVKQEMILF